MSLKKKIALLLLFVSITVVRGQSHVGVDIVGDLGGVPDGELIRLLYFRTNDPRDARVIDSIKIEGGHFKMHTEVLDGPRLYWLWIGRKSVVLQMNNGEKITIRHPNIEEIHHGDITHFVTIEGSPTVRASLMLIPLILNYKYEISDFERYNSKINDSIGFNKDIVGSLIAAKKIANTNLYKRWLSKDAEVDLKPARLIFVDDFYTYSKHDALLCDSYASLSEAERNSYYGKKMFEMLPLCVGQPFPSFKLPTVDGKEFELKDVVSKGKITIVHFWGSENYKSNASVDLVRSYHKDLQAMYTKYHDKGLNIIGISADDSSTLYMLNKVIREQKFPWPTVLDFKGNQKGSIINDRYAEGGHMIPNVTNYVLDEKGRIIAYDPSGSELQYYISTALKE